MYCVLILCIIELCIVQPLFFSLGRISVRIAHYRTGSVREESLLNYPFIYMLVIEICYLGFRFKVLWPELGLCLGLWLTPSFFFFINSCIDLFCGSIGNQ